MTTDLHPVDVERRLREAFARQAGAAPLPTPELPGVPYVTVADRGPAGRGPRPWRVLAVAAAAAAALVGVVLVAVPDRHEPPPAFQPDGTEVVLTPTAPPEGWNDGGATVFDPASVVAVQLDGYPTLVGYTRIMFLDGGLHQLLCTRFVGSGGPGELAGDGGCLFDWAWGQPALDMPEGTGNLYYLWANVPADVAYVAWRSPAGPVWQRPVGGIVIFPATEGSGDAPLVAFAADGNTVDVIDDQTREERLGTPPGGWRTDPANPAARGHDLTDDLTSAQRNELDDLANGTVSACLAAGSTWEPCVAEASAVVQDRFEAMGGKLVPYVYDEPSEPTFEITATTAP